MPCFENSSNWSDARLTLGVSDKKDAPLIFTIKLIKARVLPDFVPAFKTIRFFLCFLSFKKSYKKQCSAVLMFSLRICPFTVLWQSFSEVKSEEDVGRNRTHLQQRTGDARHENKGGATLEGRRTHWRGIWDERTTYLKKWVLSV